LTELFAKLPTAMAATTVLARMEAYEWYAIVSSLMQLVFAFAFGACLGSLINVLVYRLPRGIGVVTPPSACPGCGTQLTWRENVPVLGWIFLRGRCRFCGMKISPEYPIVEAVVGGLFALFYGLWFMLPRRSIILDGALRGLDWTSIAPDWTLNGLGMTWPALVVLLILIASLVAMTLVDAKTFTIPLVLAWVPTVVALIAHPLHALYIQHTTGSLKFGAPEWIWTIPTPTTWGWGWIGASLGGTLGLVISNLLLHFGLIRRSFADYSEWEAGVLAEEEKTRQAHAAAAQAIPDQTISAQTAVGQAGTVQPQSADTTPPPPPRDAQAAPVDLWVQYPHARRESWKEIIFLAPCILLAYAGSLLAHRLAGPWTFDQASFTDRPAHAAPLWLVVLAGVLMGYLIGGGIVWLFRIVGSLAVGKEAMGLGDVHLLAAVGACLGWIDAILAFLGAAFVALAWTGISRVFSGKLQRVLPYGPYLAIATLLVLLLRPALEAGLTLLLKPQMPIRLP